MTIAERLLIVGLIAGLDTLLQLFHERFNAMRIEPELAVEHGVRVVGREANDSFVWIVLHLLNDCVSGRGERVCRVGFDEMERFPQHRANYLQVSGAVFVRRLQKQEAIKINRNV